MPSKYEGFGLAIAEAFAHGKPVIASNLKVFGEQINCYQANDFVQLFPPEDHKALAKLMETRLREGEISSKRSKELCRGTRQWTWDDVAKTYMRLMKKTALF
jgi:glycosyltransferase involved in cell wall biosynthesis